MIVPPAKNTNCDLYDTVVDKPNAPTIFVVFRDDNAYPEYLITFTQSQKINPFTQRGRGLDHIRYNQGDDI